MNLNRLSNPGHLACKETKKVSLVEINFCRIYDTPEDIDLEVFIDTKIDINAVKAGFKVVSMKNGVVEVTPSNNPDFLSFLSPSSGTFAIIQVPDLSKTTSPSSSILRVLIKAHAMG